MFSACARIRSLWQGIRQRSDVESEMHAEFRAHIELRAEDLVRSGLSPSAALLQARREFGSTERYKEEGRVSRGLRRIDDLRFSWLDFKLGFRMLVRYPGLTLVGGVAMAVAIAIGAAAFEAITQMLWPTLPFPDGDRIVAILNWDAAANRAQPSRLADVIAWRSQLQSVRDVGAYRTIVRNLIVEQGESSPIALAEINADAFRITGAAPLLGRFLVDADERMGAAAVIVIGYHEWQRRFHGDSAIVGRSVQLGSTPATIVGVMPQGFEFPYSHNAWVPLRLNGTGLAPNVGPAVEVFGRLAPGVTLAQARAELSAAGRRAAAEFPETHEHLRPHIGHYAESNSGIHCTGMSWTRCLSLVRASLYSSNLIFVVLVALICANVALLMFARAATRESEIIVRNALGASRGRIITQLVAEALVLGGLAALAGIAIAGWALRMALRLIEYEGAMPFWWHASLSFPSVVWAVVLTLLGATIAGVLPAFKVTRGLGARLRQVAAGAGGLQFGGVWTLIIVAQVALTVFAVATTVYIGQFAARVAAFKLDLPAQEYLSVRLELDDAIPVNTYHELGRRVASEAGVAGVTFASQLPGGSHRVDYIEVEGVAAPPWVQTAAVAADFFPTMSAPMIAGRGFREADFESDRHVLVANQEFVQRVLGGRHPIGRRVRFQVSRNEWGPWHEIVGVVQQVAMTRHPEMSPAGLYAPLKAGAASVHMAVHLRQDAESFAPRLRQLAALLEPNLRLNQLQRMDRIGAEGVQLYNTGVRILIGVSLLVLGLSLAGIYSIMSFTVSRRTREIGIRIALGGDRRRILAAIFRRPLTQLALGLASGVFVSFMVLRGEVELIVAGGIGVAQSTVIVVVFTAVMLGVCLLACIVPTRRALGIQPTEALKQE
ncbi:MAG: ABC transporter permease [Longimicrobiales bacterium]